MGEAGPPAVGQDPGFPVSGKGTGATWRKRLEVRRRKARRTQFQGPGMAAKTQNQRALGLEQRERRKRREGGRGLPRDGTQKAGGGGGGEEQRPRRQCPSGPGQGDAGPGARKGDSGPGPAGLPLPAGGEAGGSARRESSQETVPSGGLAATEQSHWKVLDVGGPLGCQLEELDVTPLDSVDRHWG